MKKYFTVSTSLKVVLLVSMISLGFGIVDGYYERKQQAVVAQVAEQAQEQLKSVQQQQNKIIRSKRVDGVEVDLPEPPPASTIVEMPGVKFQFDPNDGWRTIGMLLTLVLGTLLGVKTINRIFER